MNFRTLLLNDVGTTNGVYNYRLLRVDHYGLW